MSDKLRPEDPSAEERALWDALAVSRISRGALAADAYTGTRGAWMDMVRARREAMAAPSGSKEAMR